MGADRDWLAVRIFRVFLGLLGSGAELRKGFVELIRKFDELADGGDSAACSLRGLAGNVGNNLHGVSDALRAAHLLFRSERNFLDELGRLANDRGNCL